MARKKKAGRPKKKETAKKKVTLFKGLFATKKIGDKIKKGDIVIDKQGDFEYVVHNVYDGGMIGGKKELYFSGHIKGKPKISVTALLKNVRKIKKVK